MSWRQTALLVAVLGVFSFQSAAYDPGDVNGDGTADAADVACAMATVFDPVVGCAVTTQSPLRHVVRVSATGGDYTSIQAALDSITASSNDGWLIQVGPGIYNERVTMESWVDIEGSGEGVTIINFTGSSGHDTGTVVGADDAELRHVTVQNTGGGASWAIGVYTNGTRPRLKQVRIEAFGAPNNAGIYCNGECRGRSPSTAGEGEAPAGTAARTVSTATVTEAPRRTSRTSSWRARAAPRRTVSTVSAPASTSSTPSSSPTTRIGT